MKLKNPLLVVRDMERSKTFYREVLGLHVVMDFGANVTLTGGLCLQTLDTWTDFLGKEAEEIRFGANDSDVGRKVNFGCGTVTTNYDGVKKYRCTIEDGAFIGCNTNLVAPVTVGAGSYIAAGATITKDVPADALAVARAKQENKEGWAKRRRKLYGQEH